MYQTPEIPAVVVADVDDELLAEAFVLDVREPDEWNRGHIEGATHIPLGQLQERVGEVPLDQKVLCVCA
ncbi:MAG TPA: rhodanese-like domain-containing protein, partial [Streptomyces sp.]|nr:rhodanese-like domain-containing protein [Streptomyces sp.]